MLLQFLRLFLSIISDDEIFINALNIYILISFQPMVAKKKAAKKAAPKKAAKKAVKKAAKKAAPKKAAKKAAKKVAKKK